MLKGTKQSDEAKQKIRESRLGKPSWNKGIPFSEESKQKMSEAKLGKKMSPEFCQKRSDIMNEKWSNPKFRTDMSIKHSGERNANYGKDFPAHMRERMSKSAKNREDGHIEKLRLINMGTTQSEETKAKRSAAMVGDKCYNWKGGITPVYKHIRGHSRYKAWCTELLKKHDYTDAFTGHKGGLLSCHHVLPVNIILRMNNVTTIEQALECPLIWDINNGIVILKYAHDKFHNLYGDDKNIYELTPDQIKELYL